MTHPPSHSPVLPPNARRLAELLRTRDAVVGVMGMGYVGLPLTRVLVDAGYRVIGFDPAKTDALNRGENYLKHLGEHFVRDLFRTHTKGPAFRATADPSQLAACDAIVVCVPTPLGDHREPDLSYVRATSADIAKTLRAGQLVVLESTSYPGTTREVMLPILQDAAGSRGLTLGVDFFVAFSPEREDPGRTDHTTATIPKLVGGLEPISTELAHALYDGAIATVIKVSSAEVAEAAKILENTYRAVNIALVNELKVLFTAMGIDIWEVIEAAKTKPFGFQAFYPGPGLGGHCIPIDPYYLTFKARQVGHTTRFIELAGEINHAMPEYVVSRLMHALNDRGKAVKGSRVLVLGLAYKPDIDDVRESPSFEIIEKLKALGANVDYHDPHVPHTHQMRRYDLKMSSVELSASSLASYDAVVVATAHRAIDWSLIASNARLVIDTRNALGGARNAIARVVQG